MSLQTRWLLALSVVLFASSALGLALTGGVLYRSADTGARFWLEGAGETALDVVTASTLRDLELLADAVEVGVEDAWLERILARRPSIRYAVRSTDGQLGGWDCALVGPLSDRGLGPVRCQGEPAVGFERGLDDGSTVTVARLLDEGFLFEVAHNTNTEVLLLDPGGATLSTVRDVRGQAYVPQLDLGDAVAGFGRAALEGSAYGGGPWKAPSHVGDRAFDVYYLILPVDYSNHRLVLLIPRSVMVTGTIWTMRIITVLSALVTIGTLGATAFLLGRLFRPYHELVRATKQVEQGDLSVRMAEQGPPELARLATTFNRMVDSLKDLAKTARLAGMTEVATGVLHNVGNVLTSVSVSAEVLGNRAARMRTTGVLRGARMLEDESSDLAAFLTTDPRGVLLPGYLVQAAADAEADRQELTEEIERLKQNIEHIKAVVQMQQAFARTVSNRQPTSIDTVIDDALSMVRSSFDNHGIRVVLELEETPLIDMDPVRVAQVLINLLSNAKDAVRASGKTERLVKVRTRREAGSLRVEVWDNGVGIAPDDLERIFAFGHTTKSDGHGFGLHMSAVAVQEMGGSLTCTSPGPGRGATFHLDLPVSDEQADAMEAA